MTHIIDELQINDTTLSKKQKAIKLTKNVAAKIAVGVVVAVAVKLISDQAVEAIRSGADDINVSTD